MSSPHQKLTDEKLEAMKRAYADYPSQDNEGYMPDRGGFKAGFYAAWNLLHAENKELREALSYAEDGSYDFKDIQHDCPWLKPFFDELYKKSHEALSTTPEKLQAIARAQADVIEAAEKVVDVHSDERNSPVLKLTWALAALEKAKAL